MGHRFSTRRKVGESLLVIQKQRDRSLSVSSRSKVIKSRYRYRGKKPHTLSAVNPR